MCLVEQAPGLGSWLDWAQLTLGMPGDSHIPILCELFVEFKLGAVAGKVV